MDYKLDKLLARVEKPARYTGGELNMAKKAPESVSLRFALAFPDIYEVARHTPALFPFPHRDDEHERRRTGLQPAAPHGSQ